MLVRFVKKIGHKFFEFTNDGVSRVVCVDAWINPKTCPEFCKPVFCKGWEPLRDDRLLTVDDFPTHFSVSCPTCFGYISNRAAFRKVGPYHTSLLLDKAGLSQFLYNYIIL